MNDSICYKDAGVDIEKGEALVKRIKAMVKSTYNERVLDGVGGFASLYDVGNNKLLAAGTDGVGTKLKIAQTLNIHNTIGIDLVAMCVNDILCTGAKPLFFLDYLATAKLDLDTSEAIIEGIVKGCKLSGMALIGGETAEMPGMYSKGEYDLAGFAIGEVYKHQLINGEKVATGDTIIGLASSGIHSNGYSLVRKLINNDETELMKMALTATKIYVNIINQLLNKHPQHIKGMAHITGGGFSNINRINANFNFKIDNVPSLEQIPAIFSVLKERSKLPDQELYQTFNMGVGFVIITDQPDLISATLKELKEIHWNLGSVTSK